MLQAGGVALENSTSAERYAYPTTPIDDVARAARAQELGYRTIGKELPDDVTLQAIIKSLPPEVGLLPWPHIECLGSAPAGELTADALWPGL